MFMIRTSLCVTGFTLFPKTNQRNQEEDTSTFIISTLSSSSILSLIIRRKKRGLIKEAVGRIPLGIPVQDQDAGQIISIGHLNHIYMHCLQNDKEFGSSNEGILH